MKRLQAYLISFLRRYALMLSTGLLTAVIGITVIWISLERAQLIAAIKQELLDIENSLLAAGYDVAYEELGFNHFSPWQVMRIKDLKIYSLDGADYKEWKCDEFAVSADVFDIRKIRFHFSRNQTIQKGTQTWEMEVPQAFAEMTISPENRFQDFNLRIADLTVKKLLTIRQINFAAQRMAPKQVNANGPFIETHLDVHDLTIADYTGWPMNKEVEYFYLNGNVIGTIERQPIFSESLYDWIEKDGHIEVKKMILNWQPLVMVAKGDLYFNENLAPNLTLNTSSLALVDTLDKMNANGWLEDKGVFVARILLNNKSFKKNQSDKYFTVTTPLKINDKQILIESIPVKTLDGSVRGQEKVPSSADSGTPENQTN